MCGDISRVGFYRHVMRRVGRRWRETKVIFGGGMKR